MAVCSLILRRISPTAVSKLITSAVPLPTQVVAMVEFLTFPPLVDSTDLVAAVAVGRQSRSMDIGPLNQCGVAMVEVELSVLLIFNSQSLVVEQRR